MKEAKETFLDLVLGIAAYALLACVIGGIFANRAWAFVLGVVYGAAVVCFIAYHMYRSLDTTLDLNPDQAVGHARRMAVLRLGIMAVAVVIAILLSRRISMAGVIIGMLALKLSAYLQPIIHRYITNRIYNKGR